MTTDSTQTGYKPFVMPNLNSSVILAKKMLCKSVMEVEFKRPENFNYKIGQFISLKVTETNFRAYSLASHPTDKTLKIAAAVGHIGLGSNFLNAATLHSTVSFIGPSGRFFMAESPTPNILFLATGTGIAPFIPMLRELIEFKTAPNAQIQLFFGETHESELFYVDVLEGLKAAFPAFSYTICLSQENNPKYTHGRITGKYTIEDPLNTQVYMCGHPSMVAENFELVKQAGVPETHIFHEKFTSAVAK